MLRGQIIQSIVHLPNITKMQPDARFYSYAQHGNTYGDLEPQVESLIFSNIMLVGLLL